MELIPSEYEKVIILGNGFDLNLGMKTSYCDFIKSDYFKTIIKNNNPYAQALMSKLKDENTRWIDAENELKNIANNNIQLKSIHFKELCNSLLNYISEIKVPLDYKNSEAYKFLKKNCTSESKFIIIDFNYTISTETLLKELKLFVPDIMKLIVKAHGSIKEKYIVFGIEDEAEIARSHVYLQKSFHKDFKGVYLDVVLDRASEIHVFGHSMGETDYPYFKNFFNVASDGQFLYTNKNFYMHYYGSKSHEDLMNHIDKMTNGTIKSLKQKIKFFPIDIK